MPQLSVCNNFLISLAKRLLLILGLTILIIKEVPAITCSLADMKDGNNPFENIPQYSVNNNQIVVSSVGTSATFNHIIPKNPDLKLIWAKLDNASIGRKKELIIALKNQYEHELDHKQVQPKYIFMINQLLAGVLSQEEFIVSCIKDPSKSKTDVTRCNGVANINLIQSNEKIVIGSLNEDVSRCAAVRGSSGIFMFNPANGFYSPRSETRSWDPNATFDSWVKYMTSTQTQKDQVTALEYLYVNYKQLSSDEIANLLTIIIKGPNMLFEIPFTSNQWVYAPPLPDKLSRVWCVYGAYSKDHLNLFYCRRGAVTNM